MIVCKVRDCGFVAATREGMAEHMHRARAAHARLAEMHHSEMMKPEHVVFRHKWFLKQKRLRRAAKRAGMTPEQLAAERRAHPSSGKYKPGLSCGRGLHVWKVGASGTYFSCQKCGATRTVKKGTAVKEPPKANKAERSRRSARRKAENETRKDLEDL